MERSFLLLKRDYAKGSVLNMYLVSCVIMNVYSLIDERVSYKKCNNKCNIFSVFSTQIVLTKTGSFL